MTRSVINVLVEEYLSEIFKGELYISRIRVEKNKLNLLTL